MTAGAAPHAAAESPTDRLAAFAAHLVLDDIPLGVQERVGDILLDSIACALAGATDGEAKRVLATVGALFGGGRSRIIGHGEASVGGATLANGFLVTASSLCDKHHPSLCHVTPEVIPPALASAEAQDASGSELLVALAVGLEVATRSGLALAEPEFHERGFYMPGVAGVLGAAAATGRLAGLDAPAMAHAMSLAGAQASGSDGQHGTPTIKWIQARAALGGLLAGSLAYSGFTAMPDILGHPEGGLFRTHSGGGRPGVLAGLGETWELEQISLRAWPGPTTLQSIIGLLVGLVREGQAGLDTVEHVRIRVAPAAAALHGHAIETAIEVADSAALVAALVARDAGYQPPASLADLDPAVARFAAERVTVEADRAFAPREADVTINLRDGSTLTGHRANAHGEPDDPLSRSEIVAKLERSAASRLAPQATTSVVEFVAALRDQPTIRPLLAALAG